MIKNDTFQKIIDVILFKINNSKSYFNFYYFESLYNLASKIEWSQSDIDKIDNLCKKIDINKSFFQDNSFVNHNKNYKNNENNYYFELIICLLLKVIFIHKVGSSNEILLKRFNTFYKILDNTKPDWLTPNTKLYNEIQILWHDLLKEIKNTHHDLEITFAPKIINNSDISHQIPLTVMFYEGPISRAYLETLKSLGLRPKKIIELIFTKDIYTKKTIGKWLPKKLKYNYISSIQKNRIHYWPKYLSKNIPDLKNIIIDQVKTKFSFSNLNISNAYSLLPLFEYSDNIEHIFIEDFNDKTLSSYLSNQSQDPILYTGGGILPRKLFGINKLKYLHIHPGYLPTIRGADCTLWSFLLTGYTSASFFLMSPGIDMGDIIETAWLPPISFNLDIKEYDYQLIYRAIYSFLDPWIRSYVSRHVFNKNTSLKDFPLKPQLIHEGVNYHFMHRTLKEIALNSFFNY
jgi:hypothetical protein